MAGVGLLHHSGRPYNARQHFTGHIELAEQLWGPVAGSEIVQQRPGGVGVVGDVSSAAGQLGYQPALDRAGGELALGSPASESSIAEQPFSLVAEKYGSATRPVHSRS